MVAMMMVVMVGVMRVSLVVVEVVFAPCSSRQRCEPPDVESDAGASRRNASSSSFRAAGPQSAEESVVPPSDGEQRRRRG